MLKNFYQFIAENS